MNQDHPKWYILIEKLFALMQRDRRWVPLCWRVCVCSARAQSVALGHLSTRASLARLRELPSGMHFLEWR